jgi:predicted N-acetyltransferase YhbS
MLIRQETAKDFKATEHVVEEAFRTADFTDHTEHQLVERLRRSSGFIPELSLVAEVEGGIVGHILFSKIKILGEKDWDSIALAPVSVIPKYQKLGIGGQLIMKGLERAKELGFNSVIVVGHEKYYPRFGFKKASNWNIRCPFDVPDEVFMAIELVPDGLKGVSGIVEYSKEFGV